MDALNTTILGLSAVIALCALWRNHVINSRRATVDLVMQQMYNPALIAANKTVNTLLEAKRIIEFAADDKKDTSERAAILKVINNYEFISCAIREGAFNRKLFQRMRHSQTVRDWEAFKSFIYDIRQSTGRKTLFQDFEWLAAKFVAKPLRTNHRNQ